MGNRWPLRLAPVGSLSMGASLWRLEGQLMATVVAKVTASFAIDGVMAVVAPQPVRSDDEHDGGHPMRSLVGARELAPQLYKVDVLMVGHAYPQAGAAQTRVRLAMEHHGAWVLNKMVTVYGDRKAGGPPAPFDEVRLGWEKAFGGIGHPENPLGTGYGSTTTEAPNVIYSDGRDAPASFGPIPQSFPNRKRLLDGIPRKQVTEGIAEVPATFNWAYFQSAPADQQLEVLHGDEWLHLEGIHKGMRRVRTRLPGVQVVAKVYGHAAAGVPNMIPMRADMLLIEPDDLRAAIVYRGSFPVMRPGTLGSVVIAAGVETAEEPMLWPESPADLDVLPHEVPPLDGGVAIAEAPPSNAAPRPFEGTFALDPDQLAQSSSKPLPFAAEAAASGGTRTGPPSSVDPSAGLPFASPSSQRADAAPASDEHPLAGTMSISDDQPLPASMPFPVAERKPPSAPREIPGAPWANTPASPVIPPQPDAVATATGTPPKARTMTADAMQAALSELNKAAPPSKSTAKKQAAKKRAAKQQVEREKATREQVAREKAERERLAAKEEAEKKAAAEAEARRQQEAEKFREEQQEAEREAKRRAEEEAAKKRDEAKKLRDNIYGGFKRRG